MTANDTRRMEGSLAEDFTAAYLASLGHEILCRNFTVRGGETDIISLDGEYIVFTEVKMRCKGESPTAAVTHDKIARIKKCAEVYMKTKSEQAGLSGKKMRIDVVAVQRDESCEGGFCVIKHIKGFDSAPKTARRF